MLVRADFVSVALQSTVCQVLLYISLNRMFVISHAHFSISMKNVVELLQEITLSVWIAFSNIAFHSILMVCG